MTDQVSLVPSRTVPAFDVRNVITTDELERRPVRVPDHVSEIRVLQRLASLMATEPHKLMQELVDSARVLCRADSAGISLLDPELDERGKSRFRWMATSGGFAPWLGNTLPRDFSPCGSVLDANCMLLMSDPARYFGYIYALPLPVREVLLVPFYRGKTPVGTVWIVSHTAEHKFDREDARLVRSLSQFAAAAVQVIGAAEETSRVQTVARNRVERQLADMTDSNRALAEADREKAEFLATLTHELRNALAPLSMSTRIIKLSDDREVRTQARERIERQLTHLNRLVDDLLDTSRISSGKLRLDFAEADINEIVRDAVEAARATIEASHQNLTLTVSSTPLRVRCDVTRLAQVFSNLLTNAAKYGMPAGRVKVQVRRSDGEAVVTVKDSGIGIDPEMLPRIFDLFVQIENSLSQSQGGLGIGLALVRRLVGLHGGSVEARSDGIGKGSTFEVRLPLLN